MGYSPSIHDGEGVLVGGNYNKTGIKANILIPKGQFNGHYGDVGFERTGKGFVMHADHIDIKRFNLKKLNMSYTENKLNKEVGNTSRYNILSRRETSAGKVEIQIRVNE